MGRNCFMCEHFKGLTGAIAGRCFTMGSSSMVHINEARDCQFFMAKENEKIKILRCPNCGTYMDKQGKDFWKCPYCEGEWWPPEREDTPEQLAKAARRAYFEDVRIGFFGFGGKYSGGSKSGRRYGKKKVAAPLFTQRYFLA